MALYSPEGYTVDFGLLSKFFIEDAISTLRETESNKQRILDVFTSTSLESISRGDDGIWNITTNT